MFKRVLPVFVLGLLAVLIQGTLLKVLLPQIVVPGLVLIIVLYLAFYETNILGAFLAFFLGVLLDMCGGILVGPWAGSFVFVYGVTSFVSQRIFAESFAALLITSFVASIFSNLIYTVLLTQVLRSNFTEYGTLLFEALLTALVCPVVFMLLRKILLSKEARSVRRYSLMRS